MNKSAKPAKTKPAKKPARKPKPDAAQIALSVVEKAIGGKLASESDSRR
jgi:hypothetical protein